MSEKRLSEIMSDTIYAISQAQETLDDAITKAINVHFDAGIQVEQEHIIKLLKENSKCKLDGGHDKTGFCFCEAIELIKGGQK